MPIQDVQLDDRTFEQILADARRRIPRYAPEWTDHNESDPGITLLQLFAWLGEMILYRLNKVPEKSYLKFLELIGIELSPPQPAHAELTFTLAKTDEPLAVEVPARTQVSLSGGGDGGPVIFETEAGFTAVNTQLVALQSFDGAQFQILTEANRVGGKYYKAFGRGPQRGAALYLGFKPAFPTGRLRLRVHAYTADLIRQGQGVTADTTAPAAPVLAFWEYLAAPAPPPGQPLPWRPLSVVDDGTAGLSRTGDVVFDAPDPGGVLLRKIGLMQRDEDPPLAWLRFRIDQVLGAGYDIAPRLEDVVLNTVDAVNAVTAEDELLGASNGTPNQQFQLAHFPVLPDTLALEVNEGDGFRPWTLVHDFAGSTRDDTHYTLEPTTGTIGFGDGTQGKIPLVVPPPGAGTGPSPGASTTSGNNDDPQTNIRATQYRWGGGARGNAQPGTITSLLATIPHVESVTNLRPSEGGQDEESVGAAKLRAPQMIRSGSRAVTAADFESLATQTPGGRIWRAKVLPLSHPRFRPVREGGPGLAPVDLPVPGVVTVVVVPGGPSPNPMPTEDTLLGVARWLDGHRTVTTEVYVAAPRYRKVEIDARVVASPSANSGEIEKTLTAKLLGYYHPLTGGADGTGWAFGGKIYFSEIYGQILGTPGVLRLEDDALKVYVDDTLQASFKDIELLPDELVYSEVHRIQVNYP
jgi:predicted phage baseplate assembly protein